MFDGSSLVLGHASEKKRVSSWFHGMVNFFKICFLTMFMIVIVIYKDGIHHIILENI